MEIKPVILTLECGGVKITSEMAWDASIEDLLNSFYGLCVGATFHPEALVKVMQEWAEEKQASFKKDE
jgi:hypothetical protein